MFHQVTNPVPKMAASTSADRIISISRPEGGRLRARKVVSRSKTRGTGKYPSWKMERMLQWESPHELNAFRLLDANPDVLAFREQPLVIRYLHEGEERAHYPDVEVAYGSHKELWEVKPSADAEHPDILRRTRLMEHALPHFGYTYRMVIAESLTDSSRLKNALTLLRYGRADASLLERERARRAFQKNPIAWGEILQGLLGPKGRPLVCRLILEGALFIDMGRPLTAESLVSLTAERTDPQARCQLIGLEE